MLLAEIHRKSSRDIEDSEDLLTSAVFGHLRLVQPPIFWFALIQRARTVDNSTLSQVLSHMDIEPSKFEGVRVQFWPYFTDYGEPDMLVQLFGQHVPSITLLIEVKLHAGKSGTGEFDQLARYFRLLNDRSRRLAWPCDIDKRFLIYLTKSFSADELSESIAESKIADAKSRMFGLEWNDVAEIATQERQRDELLDEVAQFLRRRGFERFHGFRFSPTQLTLTGHFYQRRFFEELGTADLRTDGTFYGK